MRVLVCGGRDYRDMERVGEVLRQIVPIDLIIHGGARGADSLADHYAKMHNIPVQEYPANWDKYGKSAGAIRNKKMLMHGRPDLVIAFPGGSGTANMVRQAQDNLTKVREIDHVNITVQDC